MKCASCGSDVGGGKKFCNKCGAPMPQSGASGAGKQSGAGFRPPGWENAQAPSAKKSAAPQKAPSKKTSINNLDRVQKNWTPPPGAAPQKESTPQKPQSNKESAPAPQQRISLPQLKNLSDSISGSVLKIRASSNKNRIPFIAGGVLAVILALLLISKISCSDNETKTIVPGYLPPDIQVMNEQITDNATETKIETYVVVSNSVQKDEISKLLTQIFEFQKNRRFSTKKTPSSIAVYAYSSENIYKTDPEWWLGRLLWVDGSEPQINMNSDALLPRQEDIGYGGLSREEYITRVDEASESLQSIMNQMRSNFREYEKLTMSESVFKEQSETLSDELYELTRNLPEPPVNDCAELNTAFHSLVESTMYFQDLFAPDSGIFDSRRLDTEEYYAKLNAFSTAQGVYSAERKKFD